MQPSDSLTFGDRLRNAIRARGLSQRAFAQRIGAKPESVGKWIRNTARPGFDNLVGTAEALDVGLDWLVLGRAEGQEEISGFRRIETIVNEVRGRQMMDGEG